MMQGFVIGATISVASTMVLARLLADRDALGTKYGRVMIGITLVEDIAVVFMTIIIPIFSGPAEGRFHQSRVDTRQSRALLIPLAFLAMTVVPRVLRRVARINDPEIFLLVAIAICLVSAAIAQAVGFSVALGAFLAGLSISGAEDLHHAHTTLIPLRDAFVALFFVSLGTLVVPCVILHNLPLLGIMLLLIVVGKFVVWFCRDETLPLLALDLHRGRRRPNPNRRTLLHPRRSSKKIRPSRRRDLHRHPSRVAHLNFSEHAPSKVGDAQNHAKACAKAAPDAAAEATA